MYFLTPLNISFFNMLKTLAVLGFLTTINLANASVVTVKVEDSNVANWSGIQMANPGFGSSGPISLNWDPYNDFFSELLAYDSGYSGGAAAFCFNGNFVSCALELSMTAQNNIIKLESFTLGFYGYGNYIDYSVTDLATETIVTSGSPWVDGQFTTLIDVNASSEEGFLILFGPDGFNGGINNITYSYQSTIVTVPTPLPTAVWLFGSGLIGLIRFSRHSRAINPTI